MFGHRVALVEQASEVGGAGINSGTVPSKTLRETALALSGWRSRKLFGVDLSLRREATVADFMRHQQQVSAGESGRLDHASRGTRRRAVHGAGKFRRRAHRSRRARRTLRNCSCAARRFSSPPGPRRSARRSFRFDDDRVHDSDEMLQHEGAAATAGRHRRRRDRQRVRLHVRRAGRGGAPDRRARRAAAVPRRARFRVPWPKRWRRAGCSSTGRSR